MSLPVRPRNSAAKMGLANRAEGRGVAGDFVCRGIGMVAFFRVNQFGGRISAMASVTVFWPMGWYLSKGPSALPTGQVAGSA
jgi:hypothetical protein